MTRVEFEKYKLLMKRAEIIEAGIPRKAIAELVASGRLTCIVLVPHGCRYFHKSSVAKLLGL